MQKRRWLHLTHLLLCEDDSPQQLILQAFHGDSEVNDGGPSADFWSVGRIGQFGSKVESEAIHYIHFLVPNFHLFHKKKFP